MLSVLHRYTHSVYPYDIFKLSLKPRRIQETQATVGIRHKTKKKKKKKNPTHMTKKTNQISNKNSTNYSRVNSRAREG
jgi:hypothetical protein